MGLNELWAVCMFFHVERFLIPFIPVISNASQEPCSYNAFLTRRQAAYCSVPLFLLSFSLTPSFTWQEGQKKGDSHFHSPVLFLSSPSFLSIPAGGTTFQGFV